MRLAVLLVGATLVLGCGKEKRDAGVAFSSGVSSGDLDTPPDTSALRETPGALPMPAGARPGVARAPYPPAYPSERHAPAPPPAETPPLPAAAHETAPTLPATRRSSEAARAGETVQRFDPPPESLKVAPVSPRRDSTVQRSPDRTLTPSPARDTAAPRRDTIPR